MRAGKTLRISYFSGKKTKRSLPAFFRTVKTFIKREEPKKEDPKKEEGAVDVNGGQSIKDRAKMFEKKDNGLGGPGI